MGIVFIDSAIDIPPHILVKMQDVKILSRKLTIDGNVISREEAKDSTDIMEQISKAKTIKFSEFKVKNYIDAFEPAIKEGKSIIYVSVSKHFSKSVSNFQQAVDTLMKTYPGAVITHIDTCSLSLASGYLAYYVYRMMRAGIESAEIKRIVDGHKAKKYCYFLVSDLKYLKNSKKIDLETLGGGASLNVKQIFEITPLGKIRKHSQVTGIKKAMKTLLDLMIENGRNVADHRVGIMYYGNLDLAIDFKNLLIGQAQMENNVDMIQVNPQIAACTGPGLLGIVFNGKIR